MGTSGAVGAVLDRGGGVGEGGRGVAGVSEGDAGPSSRSVEDGEHGCSNNMLLVITFLGVVISLTSCDRTI